MKTNDPRDRKSKELRDSELDKVSGGAALPGTPWEPHMGEQQEGMLHDDPNAQPGELPEPGDRPDGEI